MSEPAVFCQPSLAAGARMPALLEAYRDGGGVSREQLGARAGKLRAT